jgi:hypothetical protein
VHRVVLEPGIAEFGDFSGSAAAIEKLAAS